jgi:hypothetical protein
LDQQKQTTINNRSEEFIWNCVGHSALRLLLGSYISSSTAATAAATWQKHQQLDGSNGSSLVSWSNQSVNHSLGTRWVGRYAAAPQVGRNLLQLHRLFAWSVARRSSSAATSATKQEKVARCTAGPTGRSLGNIVPSLGSSNVRINDLWEASITAGEKQFENNSEKCSNSWINKNKQQSTTVWKSSYGIV